MFLKNDYNIVLKHKTVLLSITQNYYRDYLNNVVLYHEIGHFVDIVNGISIYSLKNMSDKVKNISIEYSLDMVLGVAKEMTNSYILCRKNVNTKNANTETTKKSSESNTNKKNSSRTKKEN